jgi:RNA polymerase sigma-70 factor (ECF subfamily)
VVRGYNGAPWSLVVIRRRAEGLAVDPLPLTGEEQLNARLSQISTAWTVLFEAHQGVTQGASAAQRRLLGRYQRAVYRYLFALVHDWNVADDLFQEFALRLVRGSFKNVTPERGRFRDFLKAVLRNLIISHWKRQGAAARSATRDDEPATDAAPGAEAEAAFLDHWRDELLARAFDALQRLESQSGQPLYTVLRFRADHPGLRSPEMAERLAARLGKPVTANWIRKRLHFAREKFTDLFIDEVAQSLGNPTMDELEKEVVELGLADQCRTALERRREAETRGRKNPAGGDKRGRTSG